MEEQEGVEEVEAPGYGDQLHVATPAPPPPPPAQSPSSPPPPPPPLPLSLFLCCHGLSFLHYSCSLLGCHLVPDCLVSVQLIRPSDPHRKRVIDRSHFTTKITPKGSPCVRGDTKKTIFAAQWALQHITASPILPTPLFCLPDYLSAQLHIEQGSKNVGKSCPLP